jgi:uncharacterized membrane protein
MNKQDFKTWFDIVQGIVVIGGVLAALCQLKIQSDTLEATRIIESGKFILELSGSVNDTKPAGLMSALEDHDENFHVLKSRGGKYSDSDIEDYIGHFETIGDLQKRKVIDWGMAYNEFSYDVEKAWCNKDIRLHIDEVRMEDKNSSNMFFIHFENLAKFFLARDKKEDCRNLN